MSILLVVSIIAVSVFIFGPVLARVSLLRVRSARRIGACYSANVKYRVSKPLSSYPPEDHDYVRASRHNYYLSNRETMLAQSRAAQEKRKADPNLRAYRQEYYAKKRVDFALRLQETLLPLLESNPDISLDQIASWLNEHDIKDFYNRVAWTPLRVRNILMVNIPNDEL